MFAKMSIVVLLATICSILSFCGSLFAQSDADSMLDTVLVTSSSRVQEKLREVTSNVSVYSSEEIDKSSTSDLGKFLQQQGFASIDYGSSQYIQIRGMNNGLDGLEGGARVLVLVNGRRVGITEVNQVGLNNIEQIEIVRGPAAIQYGPSALGGVINLIMKKGTEKDFSASVEAGGGSFDLGKVLASFSGGINNFDFSAGATYLTRGAYETKGGKLWPHTDLNDKTTSNIDVGYNINEDHRVGLNFNYYSAHSELPADGFSFSYNSYINGDDINFSKYEFENKNLAVVYDVKTSDGMFDWATNFSFGNVRKLTIQL
jgi:vitamin B12 transporter